MNDDEIRNLDNLENTHWWYSSRKYILKRWLSRQKTKAFILDLGSATGGNTMFMRSLGFEVLSVELSDLGCRIQEAKGIPVARADARDLPMEDCFFDIVVCLDLLEHIEEDWKVVDEIYRTLKPGGRCLVAVPEDMTMWSDHDVSVDHIRRYSSVEIEQLCRKSGLVIQEIWHSNVVLKPFVRLQRKFLKGSALKEMNEFSNQLLYCISILEHYIFRKVPSGLTVWISLKKPDVV